jgi:hypothetical protein
MTFRFQKRKGIGNVITTLIILIASVVLGAGVIFFGGSMFQSNTQSEQIKVSNVHSWVNAGNNTATTAFVVQNTGSKAVTISSITMRGISAPTSNWYYCTACATAANIQTELTTDYVIAPGVNSVAPYGALTSGSVSLSQGQAAIVYIAEAGNIDAIDSGNTYALQIQAGQATAVQQISVVTQ